MSDRFKVLNPSEMEIGQCQMITPWLEMMRVYDGVLYIAYNDDTGQAITMTFVRL